MGRLHRRLQVLAGGHGIPQGGDGDRAGHFTALVATHAVGHGPEPQIRGAEQRVFVVRAHTAGNGLRGINQGLGHGTLYCRPALTLHDAATAKRCHRLAYEVLSSRDLPCRAARRGPAMLFSSASQSTGSCSPGGGNGQRALQGRDALTRPPSLGDRRHEQRSRLETRGKEKASENRP
ncbi:hypothetical protein D3C76_1248670 [compost metagenome]